MIRLHHFTSRENFEAMLRTGGIKAYDLRLNTKRQPCGITGIWLTTRPALDVSNGLPESQREIRITVEVPPRDIFRWRDLARKHDTTEQSIKSFFAPGCNSWRISTLWIGAHQWLQVIDTATSQSISFQEVTV